MNVRGGTETAERQDPTRLVGRESERALLRAAADEALAGRARIVLVSGEPGIGKSALAEDAAAYARAGGALVLWGPCWEGDGAPAYWPWVQIIRSYARGRATHELFEDMGTGAADIARLVPEVAGRFLSLTADADTDPETARFRLFDNITGLLRAAAERQPLVLVLDDLHWADRSSLMLLRFVAQALRDVPLLVIGTYRDVEVTPDHPLAHTVGDLTRERIALRGLARDEVANLMRSVTGTDPSRGLADAVFGRTTGNPFFVKEVAQLLAAQGRLEDRGTATYAIPDGVRDVVRRRLAHLSQDCFEVLEQASILGPEFGIDVLAESTERTTADLLGVLDLAVAARIVAEVPDGIGRYAFVHALVREVIYDGLGATRRSAYHLRAGELLERRHAGAPDGHLAEIANHLVKAAPFGDPARAGETAIRAARSALGMYAWDQAVDLYTRALDVLSASSASDALRVRTMLELGDARTRTGDLAAARATYAAAADTASGAGLVNELAHAALGFGSGLGGFEVRLFDDRQIELLKRSLALIPETEAPVRAWLLARLSVATTYLRPQSERADLSRESVAMARRLGDRGALSYALASLCHALAGPDHVAERLDASSEMIRLASEPAAGAARCGVASCAVCLCDPEFALLGRRLRLVANLERGDIDAADDDIDAYARLADHLKQPLYQWYVPFFRGTRAMMRGSFAETEELLERASRIAERTSSANANVFIAAQRVGLAIETGRFDEAVEIWRSMTTRAPHLLDLPGWDGLEMIWAALAGDLRSAARMLKRWAAKGGLGPQVRDAEWLSWAALVTESAIRAGEPESARSIYETLVPYEELFGVDGVAAHWWGSVAHQLGRLATVLRRYDDAEAHFKVAIDAHARAGARVWEARSRLEYARMLATADDTRIGLRGSLAREAAAIFAGLGMDRDAAEASVLAEGTPGEPALADNSFRREGEYWSVVYDGTIARLKDSKGIRDIAALLAVPGREIAALDLMTRDAGPGLRGEPGAATEGDTGEILDDRARAEYRRRISELQRDIEDAEADGDPARGSRAQQELDALTSQLASAYGLGGRTRRSGDPAERARKAVTERIRDAVARIQREHPALHRHLKASIRTGTFCSYAPERPVTWAF